MTISIEEVLTSTTASIAWSEIAQHDVAFVAQYWTDDGSNLSLVDGEATGWSPLGYGGRTAGWWKHYAAGTETLTETFVTAHIASLQMIAVRMRSDTYTALDPIIDEAADWGTPVVTDYADDPVLVAEGSASGTGYFTCNLTLVALATMPNVAVHRADPFQVPLGTTISIDGTVALPAQQTSAIAWRPWSSALVTPAAGGGWGVWIID